jgi:hypothetical protein
MWLPERSGGFTLASRARRDDQDGAGSGAPELRGKLADQPSATPRSATRADNDHGRCLLTGDPRQLACAVADFRTVIGCDFEAVPARNPLKQPLARLLRLHAIHSDAVVSVVAVDDMREYEPQAEVLAQTGRDGDRFCGTEGFVNRAHDRFHP